MTTTSTDPADVIRQNLAARGDQIRRRTELTPEAQRVLLARAHTEARTQMDKLQADETQASKANTAKLTRTAFGVDDLTSGASPADKASTAISARDAADRADQFADPRAALALLARAEQTGDETLARAIAQKAHNSGPSWDEVLQAFVNDRPRQGAAVNSLREMNSAGYPTPAQMFRHAISTPSELSNRTDYAIAQLANDPSVIH